MTQDDTRPGDRLPFFNKVAAGAGEAAVNIGVNLPKQFAFPIYNLVLGVSPTLLGFALMIPRIFDGFIDPIIGAASDNTRSRWGRRKPYMLVGGVLSAAFIALLCVFPKSVPSWIGTETWLGFTSRDWYYAGYLCLMSMIFYTALAVFSIPYGAFTMELTRDYHERTRVMTFRTFFTYLSGLLIGWLFAISKSDYFTDPATGKTDSIKGTYFVGALVMVLVLVMTLLPTLLVRDPRLSEQTTRRPPIKFWPGLKATLKVPSFLLICGAYTIGFLGVIMVIGLGQYVNFFYVFGGDQKVGSIVQGWAHTMAVLAGIGTTILINRVGQRFEKKTVLIACLCVSLCGGLLSWFVYRPDGFQYVFNGRLGGLPIHYHFHVLAISYAMIWPGLAGLLVISSSIIADICDLDELETGQRREGTYWAVFNWIQKAAISIALLASGVILDAIGFDATLKQQADQTLLSMRLCYLVVVCAGVATAIVLVALIPISRETIEVARLQLAARRTDGTTD